MERRRESVTMSFSFGRLGDVDDDGCPLPAATHVLAVILRFKVVGVPEASAVDKLLARLRGHVVPPALMCGLAIPFLLWFLAF